MPQYSPRVNAIQSQTSPSPGPQPNSPSITPDTNLSVCSITPLQIQAIDAAASLRLIPWLAVRCWIAWHELRAVYKVRRWSGGPDREHIARHLGYQRIGKALRHALDSLDSLGLFGPTRLDDLRHPQLRAETQRRLALLGNPNQTRGVSVPRRLLRNVRTRAALGTTLAIICRVSLRKRGAERIGRFTVAMVADVASVSTRTVQRELAALIIDGWLAQMRPDKWWAIRKYGPRYRLTQPRNSLNADSVTPFPGKPTPKTPILSPIIRPVSAVGSIEDHQIPDRGRAGASTSGHTQTPKRMRCLSPWDHFSVDDMRNAGRLGGLFRSALAAGAPLPDSRSGRQTFVALANRVLRLGRRIHNPPGAFKRLVMTRDMHAFATAEDDDGARRLLIAASNEQPDEEEARRLMDAMTAAQQLLSGQPVQLLAERASAWQPWKGLEPLRFPLAKPETPEPVAVSEACPPANPWVRKAVWRCVVEGMRAGIQPDAVFRKTMSDPDCPAVLANLSRDEWDAAVRHHGR